MPADVRRSAKRSPALAASAVTAVILATALKALPATREIIEGATMLIAVAVLFSVSYWLISKVEAAKWQAFIRDKVNTALSNARKKVKKKPSKRCSSTMKSHR